MAVTEFRVFSGLPPVRLPLVGPWFTSPWRPVSQSHGAVIGILCCSRYPSSHSQPRDAPLLCAIPRPRPGPLAPFPYSLCLIIPHRAASNPLARARRTVLCFSQWFLLPRHPCPSAPTRRPRRGLLRVFLPHRAAGNPSVGAQRTVSCGGCGCFPRPGASCGVPPPLSGSSAFPTPVWLPLPLLSFSHPSPPVWAALFSVCTLLAAVLPAPLGASVCLRSLWLDFLFGLGPAPCSPFLWAPLAGFAPLRLFSWVFVFSFFLPSSVHARTTQHLYCVSCTSFVSVLPACWPSKGSSRAVPQPGQVGALPLLLPPLCLPCPAPHDVGRLSTYPFLMAPYWSFVRCAALLVAGPASFWPTRAAPPPPDLLPGRLTLVVAAGPPLGGFPPGLPRPPSPPSPP